MRLACLIASTFLVLSTPAVFAEEISDILGQKLVVKDVSVSEEVLQLNGKEILRNTHIRLGERFELEGAVAIKGESSPGGNACSGAPFVLLIKADGTSRLDGPLETCYSMDPVKEGDALVFQTPRIAGDESQKWTWTAAKGFEQPVATPFAPDKGTDWDDLKDKELSFAADVFRNEAVYGSVQQLLGKDFDPISEIFSGPGTGVWKGDNYIVSICRAHACGDESLLLVIAPKDRKVYAAWKPKEKPIKVYPSPVKSWPKAARAELKDWSKTW